MFFTGALNFLGLNDRKVVDPGANLRLRRFMAAVGLVAVLVLAWWLHGDDSATLGSGRSISGTGWLFLLILLGGLVAIGRAIWKRIDRSRADGSNPWPKMALWIGGIVAGLWWLGVMSDNDEAAIFTLVAGIIALVVWGARAFRSNVTKHRPDLLASEDAVSGARAALMNIVRTTESRTATTAT